MGWVVKATPWAALPPGKETRYTWYRRLGGPQRQSERVRKISPTLGLDPRTVQPVTNRYTDYANPTRETCDKTKISAPGANRTPPASHFREISLLLLLSDTIKR
jgi:hypothetical protein